MPSLPKYPEGFSPTGASGVSSVPASAARRNGQKPPPQETVNPAYWAGPGLHGLKAIRPRMMERLQLGASQRFCEDESGESAPGAALSEDQIALLAEELKKFGSVLSALAPLMATNKGAEAVAPGKSAPCEKAAVLPKRRRPFKPKVFVPQGVVEVAPPASLRPRMGRGKLSFACPACHGLVEVYAHYAGKGIRCPGCRSAVRAPDPRRHIRSRNLEQEVDTLLHPEQYEVVTMKEHSLVPFALPEWTRRVSVINIAACLMLIAVIYPMTILSLKPLMSVYQPERFRPIGETTRTPEDAGDPITLRERAQNVVQGFLAAPTWEEKATYVRDGERVLPFMKRYYRDHPEEIDPEYLSMQEGAPSFYVSTDCHHVATEVAVQFKDYGETVFTVEHHVDGDFIEWEASVGYNPVAWRRAIESEFAPDEPRVFRLLAAPDDYFNYGFSDPSKYLCVRLQDAKDPEVVTYGYVAKDTLDAKEIDFLLAQASLDRPRPMILEVEIKENTGDTGQVEITRLIQSGWRAAEDVALMRVEPAIEISQL